MSVYRCVYPGHLSKTIIIIIVVCKFVPFSDLRLVWNAEFCITSNLQQFAKMSFVAFSCREKKENGQHRRWTDKEILMEARLIIKTDNCL